MSSTPCDYHAHVGRGASGAVLDGKFNPTCRACRLADDRRQKAELAAGLEAAVTLIGALSDAVGDLQRRVERLEGQASKVRADGVTYPGFKHDPHPDSPTSTYYDDPMFLDGES